MLSLPSLITYREGFHCYASNTLPKFTPVGQLL